MPLKVSGGKLSHPNAAGIMFLLLLHQSSQEQKIFLWSPTVIFITKPIKIIINHWQSLSKGDDIHVFEPRVSSAQKLNFFLRLHSYNRDCIGGGEERGRRNQRCHFSSKTVLCSQTGIQVGIIEKQNATDSSVMLLHSSGFVKMKPKKCIHRK